MIYKAQDMTPDQRNAVECLVGRPVNEEEAISVRVLPATPGWLQKAWETAEQQGVADLTMEDIDAEIEAARKELQGEQYTGQ
jgi:hypothetical protein